MQVAQRLIYNLNTDIFTLYSEGEEQKRSQKVIAIF